MSKHINDLGEFVDVNGRLIECDICDRPADSVAVDISGDDEVAKFPLCQYCATAFVRGGHEHEGHNTAVREAASHYEPDVFVTSNGDKIERMLVSVAGLSENGTALVIIVNGTDLKQMWISGDEATAVLAWYHKPSGDSVWNELLGERVASAMSGGGLSKSTDDGIWFEQEVA